MAQNVMVQQLNALLRRCPVWAVWIVGLLPLALLVWDTLAGHLGVEPIRDIEHRLGQIALYLLVGGLAMTPLLRLTRVNLIRYRQAVGLLAFLYICLHLLVWVVLDMGLLWGQMIGDVIKRPYLTLGMAAFLLLIPLAVTSNRWSIRRFGGANWRRLHRLVYLAVPLAGVHYLWVGKVIQFQPVLWLGLTFALLAVRWVK